MLTIQETAKYINKAKDMLGEHKLLYLALYGSHLYGTNTPSSDIDLRGVFLPSFDSLLMGKTPKEFNYTSGDKDSKNTSDDIDLKIFSIHRFINLVQIGDTNGLDLMFSPSHKDCVVYYDITLEPIMQSVHRILNIKDANAYVGYAIGQAKKYGIKGSRLGILRQIKEYLETLSGDREFDGFRLSDIHERIIEKFYHESYCFIKNIKGIDYLLVCGSCHQLNIYIKEFYIRIVDEYNKYGSRAELAEAAGGVDWKALSHAVRVLDQCSELYKTGKITFPRPNSDHILSIKNGIFPYKEVSESIVNGLEVVDILKNKCSLDYKYDHKFILNELKRLYNFA